MPDCQYYRLALYANVYAERVGDTARHTSHNHKPNGTALASTAFIELPPTGYSCTISSVLAPKWKVPWNAETPFWDATTAVAGPSRFNTATASSAVTDIRLSLQNAVLGGLVPIAHADPGVTPRLPGTSDPNRWFDCRDPDRAQLPGEGVPVVTECKWLFDLQTGYFAIRQSWWCDDKDPGEPVSSITHLLSSPPPPSPPQPYRLLGKRLRNGQWVASWKRAGLPSTSWILTQWERQDSIYGRGQQVSCVYVLRGPQDAGYHLLECGLYADLADDIFVGYFARLVSIGEIMMCSRTGFPPSLGTLRAIVSMIVGFV
jgi:hypothetical protein